MLKNKKLITFTTLGSLLFMNGQTVTAHELKTTTGVESELTLAHPLEEKIENNILNEQKQETITSDSDSLASDIGGAVLPTAAGAADVYTSADYWTAVNDSIISQINLMNDIVAIANQSGYKTSNIYITRNLEINGNGYNLSYNTTALTTPVLRTSTSGVSVTFNNLSMGSAAYPNNNYYGILTVEATNVILNVRDFHYYAGNGGQPFYANGNTGSTLNFYGNNTFDSNGTSVGGEFIERFAIINFKANSYTVAKEDSIGADGFIWSNGSTVVNVETGAVVDVNTTKPYFCYGVTTLNLAKNASLNVVNQKGKNRVVSTFAISTTTMLINCDEGSQLSFVGNEFAINTNYVTINANQPEAIYFSNALNNIVTTGSFKLNRTDSSTKNYGIDYLSRTGVQGFASTLVAGASVTIAPATYSSGKSFLYIARPTPTATSFESQVGSKLSNVTGLVKADTSSTISNFKVSKEKLYTDGNLNSTASQNAITISDAATTKSTVDPISSTLIASNVLGNQELYIYYNLELTTSYLGYTIQSSWYETKMTQEAYTELEFPTAPLTFIGILGSFDMQSEYEVVNNGNTAIDIKPTSVSADENQLVELVEVVEADSQQVSLVLNGTSAAGNQSWNLKNMSDETIRMAPYFEDGNSSNYHLSGVYSGPNIGTLPVSYQLTFSW